MEEMLFATESHFPSSVKISVGIAKLGKTSVHFVEVEYHRNNRLNDMIPEMKALAKQCHYLLQQNGAKSHTAIASVVYLKEKVSELLEPEMCPTKWSCP